MKIEAQLQKEIYGYTESRSNSILCILISAKEFPGKLTITDSRNVPRNLVVGKPPFGLTVEIHVRKTKLGKALLQDALANLDCLDKYSKWGSDKGESFSFDYGLERKKLCEDTIQIISVAFKGMEDHVHIKTMDVTRRISIQEA